MNEYKVSLVPFLALSRYSKVISNPPLKHKYVKTDSPLRKSITDISEMKKIFTGCENMQFDKCRCS